MWGARKTVGHRKAMELEVLTAGVSGEGLF